MKCGICLDEEIVNLDKVFKCECGMIIHNKCISNLLVFEKFNKCFCPNCKRHYTLKELSSILNKTIFNNYLKSEFNRYYTRFLQLQHASISKYKYLQILVQQFPHINKLKKLVSNMKEIFLKYENFKCLSEEITQSQEMFDEEIQTIEKFNARCDLFTLTSENISNNAEEFINFIIKNIDNEIFIFESNIVISTDYIDRLKELYNKIKATEIYKKSKAVSMDEIRIIKSDRNMITKYKQLIELQKAASYKVMFSCDCGGRILSNGFCDRCFKKYCTNCYKIHSGECKRDDIETIKGVLSTSRACPNCGTRIEKEDYCDHMWCLKCHIGFDYETGQVILSNFRNPHRDKWMKENGLTLATYIDCIQLCHDDLTTAKDNEKIKQFLTTYNYVYIYCIFSFTSLAVKLSNKRLQMNENKIICKLISDEEAHIRTLRNLYITGKCKRLFDNLNTMVVESLKTAMVLMNDEETIERVLYENLISFSKQFYELISIIEISLNIFTCICRSEVCYHLIKQFINHCFMKYDKNETVELVFSYEDTIQSTNIKIGEIETLLLE